MPLIFEQVNKLGRAISYEKTTTWRVVLHSRSRQVLKGVTVQQEDNEQLNLHFNKYLLLSCFTGITLFMFRVICRWKLRGLESPGNPVGEVEQLL